MHPQPQTQIPIQTHFQLGYTAGFDLYCLVSSSVRVWNGYERHMAFARRTAVGIGNASGGGELKQIGPANKEHTLVDSNKYSTSSLSSFLLIKVRLAPPRFLTRVRLSTLKGRPTARPFLDRGLGFLYPPPPFPRPGLYSLYNFYSQSNHAMAYPVAFELSASSSEK